MGLGPSKARVFIRKHYPGFITARDAIRTARDSGDDAGVRAATEAFFDFPYRHQDLFSGGRFSLGYTLQTEEFKAYRDKAARASVTFVNDTIKEFIDVPWFCAIAIAWGYYHDIYERIPGGLLGPKFHRVVALAEEAWPRPMNDTVWDNDHGSICCTVYRKPPGPMGRHLNTAFARTAIRFHTPSAPPLDLRNEPTGGWTA